ncbi:MAG: hypothetical protein K2O91_12945 [Lachnospiraceae bacterium]|nr:hypothetical protein [Lachnospiraceae bacterium]
MIMGSLMILLQGCVNDTGGQISETDSQERIASTVFDTETGPTEGQQQEVQGSEDIQTMPAQWASNTKIVDVPELDFADDERLVMHAYFGLIIYNLSSERIEDSLNLQALGEYDDSACEVLVSQNADVIWIKAGTFGLLYEYRRPERKLVIIDDLTDKNAFDSFVLTTEIPQEQLPVKSYRCSKQSVSFMDGSYGTLIIGNGNITDISYIRNGKEWVLFNGQSGTLPELVRQDDYFYTQFAKEGAKSAGDLFGAFCTMINLQEYAGVCMLSRNGEYSEELQKEWQTLVLTASGNEVKKTEDRACYKIYINASGASLGSGLEEGENEKYIYLKKDHDGWYLDGLWYDELPSENWWK